MSTLLKRILSALVLGPIAIAAVWFGGWAFYAMMAAVLCISLQEWSRLSFRDGRVRWSILLSGILYISFACLCAVWLRNHESSGLYLLLYVFFAIWACDIGAYAAGKTIGGPKLAPRISPNKTWAGLLGGCLASVIAVSSFDMLMADATGVKLVQNLTLPFHIALGITLAVVGQAGDLLISVLKRRCGLKDTGNIIPGHGVLLDRIDALLLALPFFAFVIAIIEGHI